MFCPWVGERYGSSGSLLSAKRLLILGESHHSDGHPAGTVVPEMTKDVLRIYRKEKWVPWMRTFDNAAAAVTGKPKAELGRDGVNSFWDQVAFYNYVPVVAARSSRIPPSAEHFQLGAEPFESLLDELKPGAILVWGYRLWAE